MSEVTISSIQCPFVPNHLVPYDRFLNHIEKFKFPGKIHYKKCRFNPYHIIHKNQIDSHQKKCTQRQKYQPIEDDQDDWGVTKQKPQKIKASQLKDNQKDYSSKAEDQQNEMNSQEEDQRSRFNKKNNLKKQIFKILTNQILVTKEYDHDQYFQ